MEPKVRIQLVKDATVAKKAIRGAPDVVEACKDMRKLDRERTKELLEALKRENLGVTYKAKSRIDDLTDDLMDLMLSANLDTLHFGVESVSQRSLDRMRKGITSKGIRRTLSTALRKGFRLNPVFMLGYAGQRIADLRADAEFIKDIGSNPDVTTYLSCLTPHPGSELWTNAKKHGLTVLTGNLDHYTHKRLVAVPDSLGRPARAMDLLHKTQMEIVDAIGSLEHNPRLDREAILMENPTLRHVAEIGLGSAEQRPAPVKGPRFADAAHIRQLIPSPCLDFRFPCLTSGGGNASW